MQWFKHDSNANTDEKLQEVLLDYGLEGYGLYWYCLELIVNRVDKSNITFELKHDARIIARNTGSTQQKVESMMSRFIELGLFENNGGRITCLKLMKRMDSSMTSNTYMRDLIVKAKQSHDGIMTESANVMQEENRIEENRKNIKGSRLNNSCVISKEILLHLNKVLNSEYKPVKANLSLIEARLNEGYTKEEICEVIDKKFKEWKDTDFAKYLRPSTLFNATKFSSYYGQKVQTSNKTKPDWMKDIL
jgi:uncharacterized phage protein (TIGR02220 family)